MMTPNRTPSRQRSLARADLVGTVPATGFYEGAFLGNGDLGAVIWGADPLVFSLDKIDFWELRGSDPAQNPEFNAANLKSWMEEENHAELSRVFQVRRSLLNDPDRAPTPYPTKLPVGQARLRLAGATGRGSWRLRIAEGIFEQTVECAGGGQLQVTALLHPQHNVLAVRTVATSATCAEPLFYALSSFGTAGGVNAGVPADEADLNPAIGRLGRAWGYAAPEYFRDGADAGWRLDTPGRRTLLALWRSRVRSPQETEHWLALVYKAADAALAAARRELDTVSSAGWNTLLRENRVFWRAYWQRSRVELPDRRLQRLYDIECYKFACATRPGKHQLMLMGVWTASDRLPTYGGDFHINLFQMAYDHVYAGNRLDYALPLYEWVNRNLPRYREHCRRAFGVDGLLAYTSTAFDGQCLYDWWLIQFWHGGGAWLASHAWRHWRHTGDRGFLETRLYPLLRGLADMYLGVLERGTDGRLHLPRSSSPEYHGDGERTWGTDSTIDLAMIRFTFQALLTCSQELGADAAARPRWEATLRDLADWPTSRYPLDWRWLRRETPMLDVWRGQPLQVSHRHHSHLAAIYPLGILSEHNPADQSLVLASLKHLIWRGTGEWAGWAFVWAACLYARGGLPNAAFRMLEFYLEEYIAPNTFHTNVSVNRNGLSTHEVDFDALKVFSVEGGFMFLAAVQELLLQEHPRGLVLFPALPDAWRGEEVAFAGLRAEGGFTVTARARGGQPAEATIVASRDAVLRLRDNFPAERRLAIAGQPPAELTVADGWIVWPARAGETLEIR